MNKPRNDGGPAFPTEWTGHTGMSLRDYLAAHAPQKEVDAIIGQRVKDAANFLGISEDVYVPLTHYVQCVTKARYVWADNMLKARG